MPRPGQTNIGNMMAPQVSRTATEHTIAAWSPVGKRVLERLGDINEIQRRFACEHEAAVAALQDELHAFLGSDYEPPSQYVSDATISNECAAVVSGGDYELPGNESLTSVDEPEEVLSECESSKVAGADEEEVLPVVSIATETTETIVSQTRSAHRCTRRLSYTARAGNPSYMPERGFVVNVERLCETNEFLDLLHQFMLNTAIAALCLVSANTLRQLVNSIIFIAGTISVFTAHNKYYDILDISDFARLVHLCPPMPPDNQNQILKSMTAHFSVLERCWTGFMALVHFAILCFFWFICVASWASERGDVMDRFPVVMLFIEEEEDIAPMAMQLTVYTFMISLHVVFIFIHSYDTQMVMPRDADGRIWDVRTKGVPLRFRLLGLPSMWFTSWEAKHDLIRWVSMLHAGQHTARARVFPEELALYALIGNNAEREELACTLKEARLFDIGANSEPEPSKLLNLELCFFSSSMHSPGMPFIGDFTYVSYDEDIMEEAPAKRGRMRSNLRLVGSERSSPDGFPALLGASLASKSPQ